MPAIEAEANIRTRGELMVGANGFAAAGLPNVQVHAADRGMVWQGHGLGIGTVFFGGGGGVFFPGQDFFFAASRTYAMRASRLLTVIACHRPPRAVAMPRAFSASAMAAGR
jgi:hypothetical protein